MVAMSCTIIIIDDMKVFEKFCFTALPCIFEQDTYDDIPVFTSGVFS